MSHFLFDNNRDNPPGLVQHLVYQQPFVHVNSPSNNQPSHFHFNSLDGHDPSFIHLDFSTSALPVVLETNPFYSNFSFPPPPYVTNIGNTSDGGFPGQQTMFDVPAPQNIWYPMMLTQPGQQTGLSTQHPQTGLQPQHPRRDLPPPDMQTILSSHHPQACLPSRYPQIDQPVHPQTGQPSQHPQIGQPSQRPQTYVSPPHPRRDLPPRDLQTNLLSHHPQAPLPSQYPQIGQLIYPQTGQQSQHPQTSLPSHHPRAYMFSNHNMISPEHFWSKLNNRYPYQTIPQKRASNRKVNNPKHQMKPQENIKRDGNNGAYPGQQHKLGNVKRAWKEKTKQRQHQKLHNEFGGQDKPNVIQEIQNVILQEDNLFQPEHSVIQQKDTSEKFDVIQEKQNVRQQEEEIIQENSVIQREQNMIIKENHMTETEQNVIIKENHMIETEQNVIIKENHMKETEQHVIIKENHMTETEQSVVPPEAMLIQELQQLHVTVPQQDEVPNKTPTDQPGLLQEERKSTQQNMNKKHNRRQQRQQHDFQKSFSLHQHVVKQHYNSQTTKQRPELSFNHQNGRRSVENRQHLNFQTKPVKSYSNQRQLGKPLNPLHIYEDSSYVPLGADTRGHSTNGGLDPGSNREARKTEILDKPNSGNGGGDFNNHNGSSRYVRNSQLGRSARTV